MNVIKEFKLFLEDPNGWEFFLSGQAGTGKTTLVKKLHNVCKKYEKTAISCAYTHKACGVLKASLSKDAIVCTLHSFLKKRPGINVNATKIDHISSNSTNGLPEQIDVVFIDEYSQVGERDYMDLGLAQDPEAEGIVRTKIVYVGDPNQTPPVGDLQAVYPSGKYQHVLTHVYRQAGDNKLLDTLTNLVRYIEGAKPEPLEENKNFKRGCDIVEQYNKTSESKCLLAYTNKRVQQLNAIAANKSKPKRNDEMFSPTTRKNYVFLDKQNPEDVAYVFRSWDDPLAIGSKYKTLEHLTKMGACEFYEVANEEGEDEVWAVVFGHYDYKCKLEDLGATAVSTNADIEDLSDGIKAKAWAAANKNHPLSRARAKAWRDYITFKECVVCMDFPYAMTVHKSQGSTFNTVMIDIQDLGICAKKDYTMYLRLLYVAISRASNMVYTN